MFFGLLDVCWLCLSMGFIKRISASKNIMIVNFKQVIPGKGKK